MNKANERAQRVADRFPGSRVMPHGDEALVSFPTGGGVVVSSHDYIVVGVLSDALMNCRIQSALQGS